jgi:hypothetical protein
MATSGNSSTRSFVYGGLQIVDPCSDLSFEDGSTSPDSTTSGNNSRASHLSLKYPVFFRASSEMESVDPMNADITGRSIYPSTSAQQKITRIGKTGGAFPSANSEPSLQRFRIIINRPKIKSLYRFADPKSSTDSYLKRKLGPWFKTRASMRKRLKYHSFSNDGNDNDDDSFDCDFSNSASTKPISFELSSTKHQVEDHSFRGDPFNRRASCIIHVGGAYDNRPIFNNLFDGNEYDGSFHRDRKAMEPLLKSKTIKQIANIYLEDRNPPASSQLMNIASSMDKTEIRDQMAPAECLEEPSDMDIEVSAAVVANANPCCFLPEATPADLDDYSASSSKNLDEKPLLQNSFFSDCGCLSRYCDGRRKFLRSQRRREPTYKVEDTTNMDNSYNWEVVDQCGDCLRIPVKEKSSLLDEESLERELRKLDVLANEFYRDSPELLTMPVNSQLSAIPEVDEDLTQKSSSQSSIDKSHHYQMEGKNYSSLGAMLDNDRVSICSEEPNLFPALDNYSQHSKTPSQQQRRAMINNNDECIGDRNTAEQTKHGFSDPVKKEKTRRGNKNFRVNLEEITVTSKNGDNHDDDDSTGGISDITQEFLQIPETPPWFKKAMEMFMEVAAEEEEESGADVVEESRGLNHFETFAD